jgi:hypothetical protein
MKIRFSLSISVKKNSNKRKIKQKGQSRNIGNIGNTWHKTKTNKTQKHKKLKPRAKRAHQNTRVIQGSRGVLIYSLMCRKKSGVAFLKYLSI